jgi:7-keto-8-aminopelargonate synthetase-like enzyme
MNVPRILLRFQGFRAATNCSFFFFIFCCKVGTMLDPLDNLAASLEENTLVRFFSGFFRKHPDLHMKDMTLEAVGPDRRIKLAGQWVVNFGSDSFLGLDQDSRLHAALCNGLAKWGTHNGSSRAFASVEANVTAERKLAEWLHAESTLIYPSVTLANHGAIPALMTRHDAVVFDQFSHNSVQQGAKLAAANGAAFASFAHNDPVDLEKCLKRLKPYRNALIAVDGIYSMSGTRPPLAKFADIAERHGAVLYVDDAHGTGVLGEQGRGTVLEALGDYRNVLVVGSLSKALSCFGGFVACPERVKMLLKFRSSPLIFGGPIPPPYLEAICAAVDIVNSDEYSQLRSRLDANMARFLAAMRNRGVSVIGGDGAIAAVTVGNELATLRAGKELFHRGYYAQSVVFPAVPHHAGVIRVQVNSNHSPEAVDGLAAALADLVPASAIRNAG